MQQAGAISLLVWSTPVVSGAQLGRITIGRVKEPPYHGNPL